MTSRIPVIILSGMSQKNEQRLKREGISVFLKRAILLKDPGQLLDTISRLS